MKDLIRLHSEGVEDSIARRLLEREALWSESLAVGSREYIERIKKEYWQRSRFDEECVEQDDQTQTWVVREARDACASDSEQKSAI